MRQTTQELITLLARQFARDALEVDEDTFDENQSEYEEMGISKKGYLEGACHDLLTQSVKDQIMEDLIEQTIMAYTDMVDNAGKVGVLK